MLFDVALEKNAHIEYVNEDYNPAVIHEKLQKAFKKETEPQEKK